MIIPNGTNITACAKYNLQLPHVYDQASETDILPTFKHSSIPVGQLCDDGCTATFSKHGCTIYNKNKKPVITGIRNPETGLYEQDMTIQSPRHHPKNNNPVLHKHQKTAVKRHVTHKDLTGAHQIVAPLRFFPNNKDLDPSH